MKKAIAALAAVPAVVGAVPATAPAAQGQTWCPQGAYPVWFAATNTTCRTAMKVERYWDSHEILTPTARIVGRRWRMKLDRSNPSWYLTTFTAGRVRVQIESLPNG
jgi:hypothetical protein